MSDNDRSMIFQFICILIFVVGVSLFAKSVGATVTPDERSMQKIIHAMIGGVMEYRLDDGTRVDILTKDRAIEIDWENKWAEGIGQSLYYGIKTSRPPLVILLAKTDKWEKYAKRVELTGIECWVFDSRNKTWLKRPTQTFTFERVDHER